MRVSTSLRAIVAAGPACASSTATVEPCRGDRNDKRSSDSGCDPVGSRQTLAGVHQAARKPIDPQPAVRVEHHLNDCSIVQKARNAACWRAFATECRKGGINPRLPAPTLLYRQSWCRCVRPDQLSRDLQSEPHRRERRRCWNSSDGSGVSERGWRSVSFRELSA
jgi:hypothetical protein